MSADYINVDVVTERLAAARSHAYWRGGQLAVIVWTMFASSVECRSVMFNINMNSPKYTHTRIPEARAYSDSMTIRNSRQLLSGPRVHVQLRIRVLVVALAVRPSEEDRRRNCIQIETILLSAQTQ